MTPESILQDLVDAQLLSFYGWWQFSVCLFASIALVAIWWHIGRKRTDYGQVWLALTVLCWSFSGAVEVYYANQFQAEGQAVFQQLSAIGAGASIAGGVTELTDQVADFQTYRQAGMHQLKGWQSIFSLFNSLFILFALPWFRYIPKKLEPLIKSKFWFIVIGLPFLFSLLPTVVKMFSGDTYGLISELDVYYSVLTLAFLGVVLWASFERRGLRVLAYLSVACILVTFTAQLFKLTGSNVNTTLFSAIFKTSLVMIFFALALSWVKELAENIIPSAEHLFLSMRKQKNDKGRFEHLVNLKGIPGNRGEDILLTPAMYDLLFRFAQKKAADGEDWLEIKPKHNPRPNKTYDIQDHNEIRRLLIALLDGLFGKGLWTKEKHEQPLKQTLLELSEQRERKIRLALPVSNLKVDTD